MKLFFDRLIFDSTEEQINEFYYRLKMTAQEIRKAQQNNKKEKNRKCYANIVKKYKNAYFKDLVELSGKVNFVYFKRLYDKSYWHEQRTLMIKRLQYQIAKLNKRKGTQLQLSNLNQIIQDIKRFIKAEEYNASKSEYLSQVRALMRFRCIKAGSISYNSHLCFAKSKVSYKGMTEVTFKLKSLPLFLRLDCFCYIDNIYVNGKSSSCYYRYQFVLIDCSQLKLGENIIAIYYENKYNNDGLGYMSYFETVTSPNNQYIYTKFGVHGAHRFFPCFDQPDLKASFTFNIIFPDEWIALSNGKPSIDGMTYTQKDYLSKVSTNSQTLLKTYLTKKTGKFSVFKTTDLISTYLLCVVAGDYFSIATTADQLHNVSIFLSQNIPMTLYCIHSYSDSLKRLAPFIFEAVKISLDFYENTFGVKYPFSKYDLVFCHEFKQGGNYNVGIITFDDTYLCPEEELSAQKLLQFAIAIARENVLNLLGTYVRIKWWDQLWFNESFADFIAHYCLEKIKDKLTIIPKQNSAWKEFLAKGVAAYREDQSWETTHAVCASVANTSIATSYLDGITKHKGSAILKQLMFLMGEDCFFKGVKSYFKKFSLKNSTIDEFFSKMQTFFTIKEFTLDQWRKSWLLTRSFNTVSVKFDPNDISEEATLTIKQKSQTSFYPTLRYHKTRVAFFKEDATYDVLDVLLTPTATTTLKYKGSNLYKAVLVNVDYWSHFQYFIDPVSLKFFKNNLNKIDSSLTRMIIWHDINEQVRTASSRVNIRVADFVAFFKQHICTENDDQILKFEYSFAKEAVNNYIPIPQRAALKKQIYDQTLKALLVATQLNRIKLLKDQLTVFADPQNSVQVTQLENWRNGSCVELQPFPITASQGWEVVKIIYSVADPLEYDAKHKLLKYRDQRNRYVGIKAQLALNTCNAILADSAGLIAVYQECKAMNFSLNAKASFSQGWNNLRHLEQLTTVYKKEYFRDLPQLCLELSSSHFDFFAQSMKPIDDNLKETIDEYQNVMFIKEYEYEYENEDDVQREGEGEDEDQCQYKGETIAYRRKIKQIRFMYVLRSHLYNFNA